MTSLRSERGQELVEFAFASLIFFMMTFLIIEGGLMVWRYNMLADLAQEAARWTVVRGKYSSGTYKATGTVTDVQGYVVAKDPDVTVALTPNVNPNTLEPGTSITVTLTRPMPSRVAFFTMSGTLAASATMQIAR